MQQLQGKVLAQHQMAEEAAATGQQSLKAEQLWSQNVCQDLERCVKQLQEQLASVEQRAAAAAAAGQQTTVTLEADRDELQAGTQKLQELLGTTQQQLNSSLGDRKALQSKLDLLEQQLQSKDAAVADVQRQAARDAELGRQREAHLQEEVQMMLAQTQQVGVKTALPSCLP